MRIFFKNIMLTILGIAFWLGLVRLNIGPQSLSQLIEIPVMIVFSTGITLILKKLDFKTKLFTVCILALLLRLLIPEIPE